MSATTPAPTSEQRAGSGRITARARAVSPTLWHNPAIRAYVALASGIVCIGFSAIFTKWAAVPGPVSGFYRVAIATVVLALPFVLDLRRRRGGIFTGRVAATEPGRSASLRRLAVWLTALAGLFFALDLGFWNTSLLYTSAANSTLLGNTSTLWVSLGAALLFHERLKKWFWPGMLLALVGAAIIVGRDAYEHPHFGLGDLLAGLSSVFYAGYLLGTQRARRYVSTLPFMWLSSVVASLFLLAYVVLAGLALAGYTPQQYMALAALGLISHVLGWLAINYSLGHLPAPLTAVTLLSQPVITALLAVPLLGEALTIFQMGGGLLVLAGIYIVNRR